MQHLSIQDHIDAIRNILALPPGKTTHRRYIGICKDIYKYYQKMQETGNTNIWPFPRIHQKISSIILPWLFILNTINFDTPNGRILSNISYALICLYGIYISYNQKYTISPLQKSYTMGFMIVLNILLFFPVLFSIIDLSPSNSFSETCCLLVGLYLAYNNTLGVFTIIEHPNRIIVHSMFSHHDSNKYPYDMDYARKLGEKIEWTPGDIIMIGHQSPTHAVLQQRAKELPNDRLLLEQHLYALSCKIPLIYITTTNNHIPHYIPLSSITKE